MNSKAIGEISEGAVLAYLLQSGYAVSIPFGNNQRYDMIIDDGENLIKAQVKTGRLVNGCLAFNVASVNGFTGARTNYKGSADIFLVYYPVNGKVYRIPVNDCGSSEVRLRIAAPNGVNSPRSTIRWAKDYEF